MRKTAQGFTLVELLVVIAIIAVLAAVVVLIINPLELTRRSRDAARLTDLSNLQQAINVAVQESTSSGTYLLCNGASNPSCVGDSVSGTRTNNGTGWVKVNLGAQGSVSVPTLPVDPVNSSGVNGFHYLYCADKPTNQVEGWEIVTKLESQQQSGKMATDGGTNDNLYEAGSNLGLLGVTTGCTY